MIIATSFLPSTLGALSAVIAASVSIVAAVLGFTNRNRIREVHVKVNSQLESVERESRRQRLIILASVGVSLVALVQIVRVTAQRDTSRLREQR